jgi:succinyl-CoA synthetase alpha subunit
VVAYVAGRFAPQGKRMGHAGAMIMGKQGAMESKVEALYNAGVKIADKPSGIVKLIKATETKYV